MRIRIRLSDEDRAELKCPDWMEVVPTKTMLSEAEILDSVGLDWVKVRNGVPVIDPETGKQAVHPESGKPLFRITPGVQRVWIWLALRRNGIEVPLTEFDVDIENTIFHFIDEDTPSEAKGKGEPAPPSAKSEKPTRRSSVTRARPSRPKK